LLPPLPVGQAFQPDEQASYGDSLERLTYAGPRQRGWILYMEARRLPERDNMSKKLYVGNLPFSTTADDLRDAFEAHGTVTAAEVVADRETGRSRGFGFVEMADGGDQAIQNLNGTQFQGRSLTVNEARPREERTRNGGGDRQRSGAGRRW
jgi:RNA recognition motif-containing protein